LRKLGIEIENNSTTPMEAVVELNTFVFGWNHSDAFENMWKIHRKGRGLVAVFPENRLNEIQQRLQSFLDDMEHPIAYKIVEDPPDGLVREVDFESLLDWELYNAQKAAAKRQRRVWYALLGIIFLALVPWVFLRLI